MGNTYLALITRNVLGSMQLTLHSVLPPSLQIEIENRPKLALTTLMTVPSSHSIFRVVPSQPYSLLRSSPEKKTIEILSTVIDENSNICYNNISKLLFITNCGGGSSKSWKCQKNFSSLNMWIIYVLPDLILSVNDLFNQFECLLWHFICTCA